MINPGNSTRRHVVLYAENDENDAFIMALCWKRVPVPHPLHVVDDGQHAIDYLCGVNGYADREKFPLPTLLLLDLSMPRRNGFDVLEWVRAQPQFEKMPVLIVSSSNQEKDMAAADELGANGYFVKPAGVASFVELIRSWQNRWLS
jgi:CheY-like chemotaxis protein